MPHDAARLAEARDWISHAATDLRAGRHDLSADPPLIDDALFHAQQACEKAMKALLVLHDQQFPKTHDLSLLGSLCAGIEPAFEPLMRQAAPLSDYSWRHRYPGPSVEPTMTEADEALAIADRVIAAMRARV
ncbi:MAG: HEPN domain-containing protein [Candidatus Dormibacteria bacterium]